MAKTEWLREFGKFSGAIQQHIADDMYERGDDELEFRDILEMCVEVAGAAFLLYMVVSQAERKALLEELKGIGKDGSAPRD